MLGKLVKQELKVTSRIFLPMYIALGVITLLVRLMPGSPVGNSHFSMAASSDTWIQILNGLLITIYVIVIISIILLTYFIIIRRFYTNMFSDEGYLMFTLPVTTGQLINSKLIVAFIWQFVMFPAMLLSFLILFMNTEILHALPITFSNLMDIMHTWQIDGFRIGLLMAEIIVSILLQMCSTILIFYLSITLGQHMWPQHRLLSSVLAFLGITIAESAIGSVCGLLYGHFITNAFWMATNTFEIFDRLHFSMPLSILIDLILIGIYYFITHYMLSKKLNLN